MNLNQEELDSFLALAAHLRLQVLNDLQAENLESGEVGGALTAKKEVEKKAKVKSKSKSGEVWGALTTKKKVEKQAKVKSKSQSKADKIKSVLLEECLESWKIPTLSVERETESLENLECGEVANPDLLVQTESLVGVKSKAKSAAERTRKWRERNKESMKVSILKYLRKTAEKRRVDSDFDKKFREREARRKREWRKTAKRRSGKTLSPNTQTYPILSPKTQTYHQISGKALSPNDL